MGAVSAPLHKRGLAPFELLREAKLSFVRWSELLPFTSEPDCLLVDTLGSLGALYAAAGAAFVGGTMLAGTGGHNVLEPAALGVPVVFGPECSAVREEAEALIRTGGGKEVRDAAALGEFLVQHFKDGAGAKRMGERAKEAAAAFAGADELTQEWIAPLLEGLCPGRV